MIYLELLKNKYVQIVGAFAIGAVVGVTLLPSKHIVSEEEKRLQVELETEKRVHQEEVSSLKESLTQITEETKTKESSYRAQIDTLNQQVTQLKKNSKTHKLKIVKPDGTVIEKDSTETSEESTQSLITQVHQEYESKLKEVENRYAAIHEQRVTEIKKEFDSRESEYKKQIEELKSKKEVTVNEKKVGVEAGITTEKQPYGHATYDAFSPGFVGVHVEGRDDRMPSFGVGGGIRF
jgi:hypothetical protein